MISKSIRPRRADAISARRGGMLSRSLKTGTTTARSVIAVPEAGDLGRHYRPTRAGWGRRRGNCSDPADARTDGTLDRGAPATLHGVAALAAGALGHDHERAAAEGDLAAVPAVTMELAGLVDHLAGHVQRHHGLVVHAGDHMHRRIRTHGAVVHIGDALGRRAFQPRGTAHEAGLDLGVGHRLGEAQRVHLLGHVRNREGRHRVHVGVAPEHAHARESDEDRGGHGHPGAAPGHLAPALARGLGQQDVVSEAFGHRHGHGGLEVILETLGALPEGGAAILAGIAMGDELGIARARLGADAAAEVEAVHLRPPSATLRPPSRSFSRWRARNNWVIPAPGCWPVLSAISSHVMPPSTCMASGSRYFSGSFSIASRTCAASPLRSGLAKALSSGTLSSSSTVSRRLRS